MAALILANAHVEAHFCAETGNLVSLSAPGGPPLATGCFCHYVQGAVLVSEDPGQSNASRFEVARVTPSEHAVESVIGSSAVQVTRRFELDDGAPLLRAAYSVKGTGETDEIAQLGFPMVRFAEDFLDAFEDEEDLFADGAELGGGRELPCWRVFFKPGREAGLVVAARSKFEMSHFQIYERGFDVRPHVMTAYDTDFRLAHRPMRVGKEQRYADAFEIGPWRRERHAAILRAAALDQPHDVPSPPLSCPTPKAGLSGAGLPGAVFSAVDFADPAAYDREYSRRKWMAVRLPCCRSERVLMAQPGVLAPPLRLAPKLEGVHRIFVGVGNGDGIVVQLSGDAMPTFRLTDIASENGKKTPFHLKLAGPQEAREIMVAVAAMDGRKLELSRFPNSWATTLVDYVRFEPLTPTELARWRTAESTAPCIELSGFNDVPDVKVFTDPLDPDPLAYEANLWEHANVGISKVFWRIDGQCSDYPSKVNTMRYVSARVHGVFHPQSKAYGRVLKKTDMLALAVGAARKYGLELYGWMRFNNYSGNVQSDFYKQHPELREEAEHGGPAAKLCLAHKAVREHKIAILVEAASYGLDGLCLGFLRHPPILLYAPVLVDACRSKYGTPPPRNPDVADPHHLHTLPETDPEHTRWFRHRADYMTLFGRELRAALRRKGLDHVKIAVWVRPNHCLFDGVDLPAWLDEGLCDEVVADAIVAQYFSNRECYDVRPEWKSMVQRQAKLIRGVPGFDLDTARRMVPEILTQGYDGICTYESDYTVVHDGFRELYASLRTTDRPPSS